METSPMTFDKLVAEITKRDREIETLKAMRKIIIIDAEGNDIVQPEDSEWIVDKDGRVCKYYHSSCCGIREDYSWRLG